MFEPVVTLELHGPTGRVEEVEAIVDTGFSGHLVLPPYLVEEMELPFAFESRAYLANGDEVKIDVHKVTALWDGQERYLNADVTGPIPLVGTFMLSGYSLHADFEVGGRVVIQANT